MLGNSLKKPENTFGLDKVVLARGMTGPELQECIDSIIAKYSQQGWEVYNTHEVNNTSRKGAIVLIHFKKKNA